MARTARLGYTRPHLFNTSSTVEVAGQAVPASRLYCCAHRSFGSQPPRPSFTTSPQFNAALWTCNAAWEGRLVAAWRSASKDSNQILLHTQDVMKAVSVRDLKKSPSAVLRTARESPVVVLRRQQPEAILIHLEGDSVLNDPGIRLALGTALYREGGVTLGRAARFSELPIAEFVQHASQLGIPVVDGTAASVSQDADTIQEWQKRSSSPTQAL